MMNTSHGEPLFKQKEKIIIIFSYKLQLNCAKIL
jgi:hypothetical protein